MQLADEIDWEATYINGLTACSPSGVKLPTVLDSARDDLTRLGEPAPLSFDGEGALPPS